ncbi:MAG TPA: hypothetical protein VFS05_14155 [Gemmatimonadaceae bacterium]|nr:hypothetical protein [Gemmatimonadaceae bacterium]
MSSVHIPTSEQPAHLLAVRLELEGRRPSAEAGTRIHVTNPPIRTCYLALVRLAGNRDDVLDYAAYLLESEKGKRGPAMQIEAVEEEHDGELTLLLSKPMFVGL